MVAVEWRRAAVARPWLIFLGVRLWLCWVLFFVFRPASLARRRLVDLRSARARRRFECLPRDRSVVAPSCLGLAALVPLVLLIKPIKSGLFLLSIAAARARLRFGWRRNSV